MATTVENGEPLPSDLPAGEGLIIGVTGPPGAGKSSLVDALIAEFRGRDKTIGIVAVDPTSRATGGAILGDRIRMQRHHADPGVFIRSMATRGFAGGLAKTSAALSRLFRSAGFDFVIIETVGVGQDEIEVAGLADVTVVVLMPGTGDEVQAIKAGVMEIADIFVINKADRPGVEETERTIHSFLSAPIFRTVAIDGTGVADLVDALVQKQKKQQKGGAAEWAIDHLGIAVRSIEQAMPFYTEHLGMIVASREKVLHEGVEVAMIPAGDTRIELLEPLDGESTIARFLEKRGPGLHHVAMRVSDLPATVRKLESAGARMLGKPQRGAGGHLYVFVQPASAGGVLWELIQA